MPGGVCANQCRQSNVLLSDWLRSSNAMTNSAPSDGRLYLLAEECGSPAAKTSRFREDVLISDAAAEIALRRRRRGDPALALRHDRPLGGLVPVQLTNATRAAQPGRGPRPALPADQPFRAGDRPRALCVMSVNTIRTHMRHLYDKLGAHRRLGPSTGPGTLACSRPSRNGTLSRPGRDPNARSVESEDPRQFR